jgi:hypothetical protein
MTLRPALTQKLVSRCPHGADPVIALSLYLWKIRPGEVDLSSVKELISTGAGLSSSVLIPELSALTHGAIPPHVASATHQTPVSLWWLTIRYHQKAKLLFRLSLGGLSF